MAACLVPGFVFLRVSEARNARPARSSLLEAVELAGIGAAASLISVTVVLAGARAWGILETTAFAAHPGTYLLQHPVRALGPALAVFHLSCLLAWFSALIAFAKQPRVFEPAGSTWARVFFKDRPPHATEVVVTVELRDGRRVAGRVHSYTAQLEDDRELALIGDLAAATGGAPLTRMDGDFLLVRESQIATITGRYFTPAANSEGDETPTDSTSQAPAGEPAARTTG